MTASLGVPGAETPTACCPLNHPLNAAATCTLCLALMTRTWRYVAQ